MKEITAEQQMRLDILRLVLLDTAAAQITIDFVKDEKLKFEIFRDLWHESGAESTPVARAQKSIQHEFRNLQKRSINLKTKKLGCSYFVRLSMH